MQNHDYEQSQSFDYRGKRGLILLRVSTEEQERKYGFPSQLRSIREKVLNPLGIRIFDEEKFIKRDTYTGMEFREREVLTEILEMAKRREFDVLVMDVLDRLGRKGLQREIYRAELRMQGVRILTTKPEEHADDDSLMGEMVRLLHGFKAEEERNDIIRRTQNGKRERVLKDHKLLGTNRVKYGLKFKDADKGAYIRDNDIIKIKQDNGRVLLEENGEPWTKARVRQRMFELVDQGWTVRGIATYLTSQYIPTGTGEIWDASLVRRIIETRYLNLATDQPILAYGYLIVKDEKNNPYTWLSVANIVYELFDKGMKAKEIGQFLTKKGVPTGKECEWHPATVSQMLKDVYVIGKAPMFVHHTVNVPGVEKHVVIRPEDEWIYLPDGVVEPILITEDGTPDVALFERVQQRKKINKESATRNNHNHYNYLLRGGYIKCGYCGGNMTTGVSSSRGKKRYVYVCSTAANRDQRCRGGLGSRIDAHIPDKAVWSKAVEIIRDPSEVDHRLEKRRKADPTEGRRQHITGEIAKIKEKQSRLRDRLEDEDLDDDTYTDIKRRLKELADQKRGYENELTTEINIHEEWSHTQEKLRHFHKRCQEMREKLDDLTYEPDYDFKRQAIEFFGFIARIQKAQDGPRITIESNPPSIVSNRTSAWSRLHVPLSGPFR